MERHYDRYPAATGRCQDRRRQLTHSAVEVNNVGLNVVEQPRE